MLNAILSYFFYWDEKIIAKKWKSYHDWERSILVYTKEQMKALLSVIIVKFDDTFIQNTFSVYLLLTWFFWVVLLSNGES